MLLEVAELQNSTHCGFHVYISPADDKEWTLQELKNICVAILYFDDVMTDLLPWERPGAVPNSTVFRPSNLDAAGRQNHIMFHIHNVCDLILAMQSNPRGMAW